jgi:hypothetical protein
MRTGVAQKLHHYLVRYRVCKAFVQLNVNPFNDYWGTTPTAGCNEISTKCSKKADRQWFVRTGDEYRK